MFVFVWFFVPETKGIHLEQMDQIFGPKKDLTSKLNDDSKKEDGENGGRASIVEEDYSGLTLFLSLCVPSLQILLKGNPVNWQSPPLSFNQVPFRSFPSGKVTPSQSMQQITPTTPTILIRCRKDKRRKSCELGFNITDEYRVFPNVFNFGNCVNHQKGTWGD
ncbi:hypothetical protein BGZ57DRAFT_962396 [Hyaloscypha finlandica]|nr:hypothetical protein BGZ57DRAFT_962396 [Hyaloscypha finlandica]